MRKRIVLFCVLISALSEVSAQNIFQLKAAPAKNVQSKKISIQLKFIDPVNVVNNYKVNVYRKEGGGGWQKINQQPVERATVDTVNRNGKDDLYNNYVGFVTRKVDPQSDRNSRAFMGVLLVSNNKMAAYAGCFFEDANIEEGKTYQYKLTDAGKNDETVSDLATVTATIIMKKIANLTSRQEEQNIILNWSAKDEFFSYKVFRKTDKNPNPILLTPNGLVIAKVTAGAAKPINFVDTALAPGTTCYYQLYAYNAFQTEVASSEPLKITVKDLTLPSAVTSLRVERIKKTLLLTWVAVKDRKCTGYNIYRAIGDTGQLKKLNRQPLDVGATKYTDSTASEGVLYSYYVQSVSVGGNTANSIAAKAALPDMTPPAKPKNVKGIASPGMIRIDWAANTERDLKGYWVYRATKKDDGYFNVINPVPITSTVFVDSLPATSKNDYVYRIQAVDNSYNKSDMSDTVIVLLPDVTPPNPITIESVRLDKAVVRVNWQKGIEDDIAGYNVYKASDTASAEFKKLNMGLLTSFDFVDNIVPMPGTKTAYYVVAVDKAGNVSPPSIKAYLMAPTDTMATMTTELTSVSHAENNSNSIKWRKEPAGVVGYVVFRKGGTDTNFTAASDLLDTDTFIDKGIDDGVSYEYYVRTYFSNRTTKNSAIMKLVARTSSQGQ